MNGKLYESDSVGQKAGPFSPPRYIVEDNKIYRADGWGEKAGLFPTLVFVVVTPMYDLARELAARPGADRRPPVSALEC